MWFIIRLFLVQKKNCWTLVLIKFLNLISVSYTHLSAMALAASLSEVVEQDENMSLDQFKNQREIISQQILGTAVNTLFFGVLGATVGLILWFVRLNYRLADIFNSKLLMAEVAAMLLGMLGILFAIWLSGYFVQKSFEQKNTDR